VARLTVVIGFMGAGKTTLARELAAARVKLTPDAQALLESSLPADRALLRGEIEKLRLFATEDDH